MCTQHCLTQVVFLSATKLSSKSWVKCYMEFFSCLIWTKGHVFSIPSFFLRCFWFYFDVEYLFPTCQNSHSPSKISFCVQWEWLCTYTRANCLCRRHRSARHGFDLNTRPEWTREILNKTHIKTLILLYKEIYLLEVEVGSMGYLEWFDLHLKNVLTHKFWWKRDITLVSFQSLFLLFPTIVIGCPSPVLNYPRLSWYSLFCYPVFASAYPSVYLLQIQMQI